MMQNLKNNGNFQEKNPGCGKYFFKKIETAQKTEKKRSNGQPTP
jgi:hypothetical protein